jgi:hypothetical protein
METKTNVEPRKPRRQDMSEGSNKIGYLKVANRFILKKQFVIQYPPEVPPPKGGDYL